MAQIPTSKAQTRAIALLNLGHAADYTEAANLLESKGFPRDGVPSGHWRTAAKLTDSELLAQLKQHAADAITDYETTIDRY